MKKPRRELDAALANKILTEAGRTDPNARFDVKPMGGGIASTVLLVENGKFRHVLKQPLRKFRVRDEWIVDTDRVAVEHQAALLIQRHMGEDEVVPVVGFDEANEVLVMEAAGAGWSSWKERLFERDFRPELAKAAATTLGRFHGLVRHLEESELRNDRLFGQQRLDPYLRTAAQRTPSAAQALERLIGEFPKRNDLVHGDYSPKNLLTNGFSLRMIDHEVVTRGDAAFDLAFLINHLLLKSVHMHEDMDELQELAWAAYDTYMDRSRVVDETFDQRFVQFLGAVHLARAVGKSKAEYLTEQDKRIVAAAGTRMLVDGMDNLESAIAAVRSSSVETRASVRP